MALTSPPSWKIGLMRQATVAKNACQSETEGNNKGIHSRVNLSEAEVSIEDQPDITAWFAIGGFSVLFSRFRKSLSFCSFDPRQDCLRFAEQSIKLLAQREASPETQRCQQTSTP